MDKTTQNNTEKKPDPVELLNLRILDSLSAGLSKIQISKNLKISRSKLYEILNTDQFKDLSQKYFSESFQLLKKKFCDIQLKALNHLEAILDDNNSKTDEKLKACHFILRSGYFTFVEKTND